MTRFISKNKAGLSALLLGIVFIFLGVRRNEVMTVLMKAVAICLECIGIG